MELMFNELSANLLSSNIATANTRMVAFAETANEAHKRNFMQIRSNSATRNILLANTYTLHDWIFDKTVFGLTRDQRVFLAGMFVKPFINEQDEDIENQFVSARYTYEGAECEGLAAAYLYGTLSISFQSDAKWTKNNISITIEPDEGEVHTKQVHNVFSKDCFSVAGIRDYIASIFPIILEVTPILPADKHIHIAGDHHGKHELELFWDKIKHSPYVTEARSTEFVRKQSKFIVKIEPSAKTGKETGVVIIAPNDEYYTLRVQTTGRNYHETAAIAKILEEEYS